MVATEPNALVRGISAGTFLPPGLIPAFVPVTPGQPARPARVAAAAATLASVAASAGLPKPRVASRAMTFRSTRTSR